MASSRLVLPWAFPRRSRCSAGSKATVWDGIVAEPLQARDSDLAWATRVVLALEGTVVAGAELLAPHGAHLAVHRDLAAWMRSLASPPVSTRLANFKRSWSLMNSVEW